MRARWRRACCLNTDSYEEQPPEDEPPRPWAAAPAASKHRPGRAAAVPARPAAAKGAGATEPSPQLQSRFFAALPLEVRRMVYAALWRGPRHPLPKLHIHSRQDDASLVNTPCVYEPSATCSTRGDDFDAMQLDANMGWSILRPPWWYWQAYALRMEWAVHWKCQAAVMDRDCVLELDDNNCAFFPFFQDLRRPDVKWLGCFLVCRKMWVLPTRLLHPIFSRDG